MTAPCGRRTLAGTNRLPARQTFPGSSRCSAALGRHVRNFLDCVKSRKREGLNQEIASGHVSSVLCHAGNVAWRTGKKLKFDAKTETFDDAESNKYLGREYRKGYELPNVS